MYPVTLAPRGWDSAISRAITIAEEMNSLGIRPTLRAVFYRLAAKGYLVHSQTAYRKLSSRLAEARRAGRAPWGLFEDRSRSEMPSPTPWVEPEPVEDVLRRELSFALDLAEGAVKLPRWYGQRYYVEVWVEKEAMSGYFEFANRDWEVTVFPHRGYASATWLYKKSLRFREALSAGRKVVLLQFGDWDPSGLDIPRAIEEEFRRTFGLDVEVLRVALTPEQIAEFGLPTVPPGDPSYERVKKDPRYGRFVEVCRRHGIPPHVVELDAMVGQRPSEFVRLVEDAIRRYFDWETYKAVLRIQRERIDRLRSLKSKIQAALREAGGA